jgi:Flp pilus assembly protein protease CpaA
VHRRAFGWRLVGRILSAITLLTPSWRVEHPQAVATLVARDPVSLSTWATLTVVTVGSLSAALAFALLGSTVAILTAPVLLAATITVAAGLQQRVSAWRTAAGRRRALVVSNVAVYPKGCGHGTTLMAAIVRFADEVERDLVLMVNPANDAGVRLYRSCGFVADEASDRRRTRMVRPAAVDGQPHPAATPSWLVPINVGTSTAVVAAVVGAALVVLYWGTPAAWLMAPLTGVAALAADNDARTLRIPNRLVAGGASLVALTVACTAIAFDAPIVWPSIVGAAIFAVPLFVSHALSHGGTGLGDVKLGAVLGLVAGAVSPSTAFGAVLVSMLLGSVFGLFWRRRTRGGFPLAPALAAGTTLVLALWAELEGPTTW